MNSLWRRVNAPNCTIKLYGENRLVATCSNETKLLYHEKKWNDKEYYHDHDDSRMVGCYGWLSRYVEHEKKMLVREQKMVWKPSWNNKKTLKHVWRWQYYYCFQSKKVITATTAFRKYWYLLKQEKSLGKNYKAYEKKLTNCAINWAVISKTKEKQETFFVVSPNLFVWVFWSVLRKRKT